MRWSEPYGDVGRLAETTGPPMRTIWEVTVLSEIPCQVTKVALRRSDPARTPAHNGEALTGCLVQGRGDRRRVMPWEALCLCEQVWPRND